MKMALSLPQIKLLHEGAQLAWWRQLAVGSVEQQPSGSRNLSLERLSTNEADTDCGEK
jgi:hypothetical protein